MAEDSGMFSDPRGIEQIVWQMRLSDYTRGLDRARIDSLANGAPPYPENEAEENGIEVNVNDLTMARQTHDARIQLYQAFNKPDSFFTMRTDCGAAEKRYERGLTITKLINRPLKRSIAYYEGKRCKFAGLVLHGVGPSNWASSTRWRPIPVGQSDVLIPSRTLLTFDNLPFFAIFRAYTATELKRLTRNVTRGNNPGWDMKSLESCIKWADEQTAKLWGGTNWAEYWSPEKRESRYKDDSGVYASDLAQTIDCWDFYYWDDHGGHEGWRRRLIFDAWGGAGGWKEYGRNKEMPTKNLLGKNKGQFLFSSGNRVFADRLDDIIHFQFADLSAVQPFTYHGVRSLGFLLYAACHLQNRLRCASWEANFENLMMYFRVHSLDEAERALKIEMVRRGVIDESVRFLRPEERWSPDHQFTQVGLSELKQIIQENSASYVQNQNWSRDRTEKTKFQVMAEVNAMQTLVSSALQQAYRYEQSEYETIVKRFMNPNSDDPDVMEFRARALASDIPESLLVANAWDVAPERIWGGGNKTMEMQVAGQLMEWRSAFSADAQEHIKRKAVLAVTDNADEASVLVPRVQPISDARQIAMNAVGSIMVGAPFTFPTDQNHLEICETLIAGLGIMVDEAVKEGGMVSRERADGFVNMLTHIGMMLAKLSEDKAIQGQVAQMQNAVAQIQNEVKAMYQRLDEHEKAQASQQGNGEMAKLQMDLYSKKVQAEAKAQNTRESHAERTAQRQAQQMVERQEREQDHQQELRHRSEDHAVDQALKIAEAESRPREVGQALGSNQGGSSGA